MAMPTCWSTFDLQLLSGTCISIFNSIKYVGIRVVVFLENQEMANRRGSEIVKEGYLTKSPPLDKPLAVSGFMIGLVGLDDYKSG